MITLVFIRHGATKGNLKKRYIGRTDEPLCDEGISQAINLRKYDFPKAHIFVSPMKRAVETAELIFPKSQYVKEEDLREMDFGIFEGKSADELLENEDYKSWVDSMCLSPVPKGENLSEFKNRCVKAFKKIIESLPDKEPVSFVVHGGVIMAILEAFEKDRGNFYDYHIENGEFLICGFEKGKIII